MTAGATRRKDTGEILLSDKEPAAVGEYEAGDEYGPIDDKFRPFSSSRNHTHGRPVAGFDENRKPGYKFHKVGGGGTKWYRGDGGREVDDDKIND